PVRVTEPRGDLLERTRVGEVRDQRLDADGAVIAGERVGQGTEPLGAPRDDHQVVTRSRESPRELLADPRRGARDERDRPRGHRASPMASATASAAAATGSPTSTSLTARCGSFSPCPVTVQTTVSVASTRPSAAACRSPVTDAADAGSTNTPSSDARKRY